MHGHRRCAAGRGDSLSGVGPITFATGKVDTSYLPACSPSGTRPPGQRVTLIQLPEDADDQHAQMVANLQTGSGPYDVLSLDVIWTAEFASNGWIVPISPRLVPLSDFLPPAVATARYDGRLYAVPFTSNAGLLYYRKDILAKAGRQRRRGPGRSWPAWPGPSRPDTAWADTRASSWLTRA